MKVSQFYLCFSALIFLSIIEHGSSAKILGVFPLPAQSHFILGYNLMMGLAEKGHEIVIISSFSAGKVPKDVAYSEIIIEKSASNQRGPSLAATAKQRSFYETMLHLKAMGEDAASKTLGNPQIKKLLASDQKFDAIIVEQFHIEALKIFAWHYNAPLIVFSTVGANSWVNHLVGNPAPPSYIPDLHLQVQTDMNFFQRIDNVRMRLSWYFYNNFLLLPSHDKIVHKFFPQAPSLDVVIYNTSLILLNSDVSTNHPTPKVPNMIDIGGFHVKSPKKLPTDLQEFLDEASYGVIYFSMGSRLKSADLPLATREMFLRVFSKLKQKVLWKWEEENLPGKPANVEIKKWLPQNDILAHPNIKLFITHGGLLSKIETIYHGKPVLSIPVFGDQKMNAEASVAQGFGLRVGYLNLTEEYFEECVIDLLNNPKYSESAKKSSAILHDKPLKPIDTAAFWIEYVIRHKGAPHLRVAALKLNWYQYLLLDVTAFCVILILLFFSSFVYLSRKIVTLFRNDSKIKTN